MVLTPNQNQSSKTQNRFVELRPETVTRLDGMREEDQKDDKLSIELANIYERFAGSISHGGDPVDNQI